MSSKNGLKPALLVTQITPDAAQAYLGNIADALSREIIPDLGDRARQRAMDCLHIVSRLMTDTQLSEKTRDHLKRDDVTGESDAIESANQEAMVHLASLQCHQPSSTHSLSALELEEYLKKHELGGERTKITEVRILPGGRSKLTAFVRQQGALALPADCIIRQDLSVSITEKTVVTEYALLRRLREADVLVPEPLLLEGAHTGAGNPFMLMSVEKGAPVGVHFMALPPVEGPLKQLAENLGRFHSIAVDEFSDMAGIETARHTASQLLDALAAYEETIDQLDSASSRLLKEVLSWLRENAAQVSTQAASLVHGDLGFHNLLVDGNELSAILDWEMAHIGNPAYDLGYLRHAISDDEQWRHFVSWYRAAGGPDVPEDSVDYYTLFTGIWWHQIQLRARAALCSNVLRNIEIAVLCADFAPQVLVSIGRTFRRVTLKT